MNLTKIAAALNDASYDQYTWTLLIYGDPKSGKTQLAATVAKVPEIERVWFIDIEKGTETLETMFREGKLTQEQAAKINVIKIPDLPDRPLAFETVMKMMTSKVAINICEEHGKVNCACKGPAQRWLLSELNNKDVVILDSGSQFADSVLNFHCMGKGSDFKPGWDEFGAQGRNLADFLSIVQGGRTNFIVLTHIMAKEVGKKEDDKVNPDDKLYPLMGTKAFSMKVAKYFGHVIFLDKKLNKHISGSSSTWRGDVITGSRADWKIEKEKESDLSLLFASVQRERKERIEKAKLASTPAVPK